MSSIKQKLDLRALRWIFGSILVVIAAILVPLFMRSCKKEAEPMNMPSAYAPLFIKDLEQEFYKQDLVKAGDWLEAALLDSRDNNKKVATLEAASGDGRFYEGILRIPFVYFEGVPKPESDREFDLFLAAEASNGIIERVINALFDFADTGSNAPKPGITSVISYIAETLKKGAEASWTWNNIQFNAVRESDLSGNYTLTISFYVLPEETPEPTGKQ
jgi:hypothetical protein